LVKLEILARLEETALSILMRESGVAFFSSLTLHSLSMAFVVGVNFAIALRVIGFAPRLNISALSRFYVIHWYAAGMIFISGIALLLAYPAKALTNPVFYIKLCAVIIGLLISKRLQSTFSNKPDVSIDSPSIKLAYLSIALWVITLTAGRFLAYTHSILLASRFY
tara:strand:- start:678 stop:1175 length:498 start_codon:yes stop_codon:yes gene_type:complete